MINIKNSQRTYTVYKSRLEQVLQRMLNALGYGDFDLGVLLTTNKTIHRYNKQYRGKDKPTDILSFPVHHGLVAGQKIEVQNDDQRNLGDLIISMEYLVHEAGATWNRDADQHLVVLLAHGIAHLLGHDHETDEQFALMQKIEKKLIKTVPRDVVLFVRKTK